MFDFDESGNLGRSGRYFVISCIDTCSYKSLHNMMKRKLLQAKTLFPSLNNHSNEIKAAEAFPCVKHHILESIVNKDLKISFIVVDLHHVKEKLFEDKNLLYNYVMRLLLDKIITEEDNGKKINILCDNKTTKVASANSFSDYIKLHFIWEKRYDIDLNIEYLDSDAASAYVVQAADYVANAIYTFYEYTNSLYTNVIMSKFDVVEEFPFRCFGK